MTILILRFFWNLRAASVLASAVFLSAAQAAPPRDLSIFDKPVTSEGSFSGRPPSRLKETAITAGEPLLGGDAPAAVVDPQGVPRRVLFDVVCRLKPGRKGAGVLKLKTRSHVFVQKKTMDWLQVSVASTAPTGASVVLCWVPSSAVAP